MGFIQTEFATLNTEQTSKDQTSFGRVGLVKRLLDISIASTALLFLAPVFLVIMLMIKLTSKGSIFFLNERVGYGGKVFAMYKFRSMHTNGDDILNALLDRCPKSKAHWEAYQKLPNDPRITRIGHFLRKSSIDELPQLINVLKGNMSIVGPRPILPNQQDVYGVVNIRHYARTRPGITGPWQVGGRNAVSFQERIKLERDYAENWSIWLDIKIMFRTVPVVLFPKAAF
jgi:exopolysaccharide production protein ExoY